MRLLLTSSGLADEKIKQFFISQLALNRDGSGFDRLDNKTAALITAIKSEQEKKYIDESRKELEDLGIKVDEIDITKEDLYRSYPDYDIYYICGGNTFFILDRLRATGMDRILVEAVKNNKFYLGVSAGSILAGPDIAAAGYGQDKDVNDIGLYSLGSFHFIPFLVFPHYTEEEKKAVIDLKKCRFQEPVIALTDSQALFVTDAENILIGEKGGLQFCEGCKLKDLTI